MLFLIVIVLCLTLFTAGGVPNIYQFEKRLLGASRQCGQQTGLLNVAAYNRYDCTDPNEVSPHGNGLPVGPSNRYYQGFVPSQQGPVNRRPVKAESTVQSLRKRFRFDGDCTSPTGAVDRYSCAPGVARSSQVYGQFAASPYQYRPYGQSPGQTTPYPYKISGQSPGQASAYEYKSFGQSPGQPPASPYQQYTSFDQTRRCPTQTGLVNVAALNDC